jgi:hypothetical protein
MVRSLRSLTACTSHTSRCAGSSCTVDLTGAQTIEIDPGVGLERDLRVGPIEPGAVTVSVYGDQARCCRAPPPRCPTCGSSWCPCRGRT